MSSKEDTTILSQSNTTSSLTESYPSVFSSSPSSPESSPQPSSSPLSFHTQTIPTSRQTRRYSGISELVKQNSTTEGSVSLSRDIPHTKDQKMGYTRTDNCRDDHSHFAKPSKHRDGRSFSDSARVFERSSLISGSGGMIPELESDPDPLLDGVRSSIRSDWEGGAYAYPQRGSKWGTAAGQGGDGDRDLEDTERGIYGSMGDDYNERGW